MPISNNSRTVFKKRGNYVAQIIILIHFFQRPHSIKETFPAQQLRT